MQVTIKHLGLAIIGAAALLASGTCSARDPFPSSSLISGRVQGSYLRAAPGVFIESGIAPRSMEAPKWVDVAPKDGGTGVLAQLPADMDAARGAEVDVRLAQRSRPDIAPVGEKSQVVAVNPRAADPLARRLAQWSAQ